MNNIKLIQIKKLKNHEETDSKNLQKVRKKIFNINLFTEPIIVERNHLIILDGHHRTKILKELGYKKIPAYLVNYKNKEIKVVSRRKNISLSKKIIINKALNNKLFPYKTSKHIIPNRPKGLKIKLEKLI